VRKRELLERIEELEKQMEELRQMLYMHQAMPHPYTVTSWPQTPPIITWGDNYTWSPDSWSTSTYRMTGDEQWSYTRDNLLWAVDDVGRHYAVEKAGLTTSGG
jgi:hypothetical protein